MTRSIRVLIIAIATCCTLVPVIWMPPAFAADPGIQWEIDNRFRYFKDASDFRDIADKYAELQKSSDNAKPTVLAFERELEKYGLPGSNMHNGWAAGIFENTCGWLTDHRYSSCKMENNKPYLAPTSSMVANLILHTIGIGTDTCEWLIDDTTIAKQPCDGPAIAKNVKYDVEHKLEVRPSSGAPQSVKIVLKDILIVSLGDSFSAGEGNPERPVTLRDDTYYNYGASSPGREFPVRLRFFEDVELRPFQQHAAG